MTHCAPGISLSCCGRYRGPRKPTRCLPGRCQPKNCTPIATQGLQHKAFNSSGRHRPNRNVPIRHRWRSFRGGDITLYTNGPLCNLGSATTVNPRHPPRNPVRGGTRPTNNLTWDLVAGGPTKPNSHETSNNSPSPLRDRGRGADRKSRKKKALGESLCSVTCSCA